MWGLRSRVLCFLVLVASAGAAADSPVSGEEPLRVRYPHYTGSDPIFNRLTDYFAEVLDLALDKSGRDYTLVPVPGGSVTDRRAMRNLDSGVYDVNFLHSNASREATLRAVYFPMFKGLAGWRLLLIKQSDAEQFERGMSESALKSLRAGLGHDWPDVKYMRAHGYSVVTSINRDSLINMLLGDRVDYLSRSVIEVWDEMAHYQGMPLTVACCVALKYPSAFYLFTSRDSPELAGLLDAGLNLALQDGSFDRLFQRFYAEALARSELGERQLYELDNPDMTDNTPLQRRELWYQR